MKLILQGPPASGKTTLAKKILDFTNRKWAYIHTTDLKDVDEFLRACHDSYQIAFFDNLEPNIAVLQLITRAYCDVIVTTMYPLDKYELPVYLPVWRMEKLTDMRDIR